MMVKNIKISDIEVRDNRFRPISITAVDRLAENIVEIGLLEPIVVSQENVLLAGNHRLQAFKKNNESVIPCHIYQLEIGDDGKMVEFSENEFRTDLTKSEKQNIYQEMRKVRDNRRKNGGNNTRKIDSVPKETESIYNKKKSDELSEELRNSDAKAIGFTNKTEQKRVSEVCNKGINEVVEAMDSEIICRG